MARTKKYQPTEFMLPTSHYDKERAAKHEEYKGQAKRYRYNDKD